MFNSWYKHGVGKNLFKNLEYSLWITLRPEQNSHYFTDDIFQGSNRPLVNGDPIHMHWCRQASLGLDENAFFSIENVWIFIKFVP